MNKIKHSLYILILIIAQFSFGQLSKTDSLNIAYKAKLLTTSRLGLADSITIHNSIQNQKVHFIKNPTESVFFLKIKAAQKFYGGNKNTSTGQFGHCNYYAAYMSSLNKFYRIGGFDSIDIDDFFNDLESYQVMLDGMKLLNDFDYLFNENKMNLLCLMDYYDMNLRKRRRERFKCFNKCSEIITTDVNKFIKDNNLHEEVDKMIEKKLKQKNN